MFTAQTCAPEKPTPRPKNRVGDFSDAPETRAQPFSAPPIYPHQETFTASTTTVSGVVYWLSKDPIGISGGLNLYAFCGNNPVNYVDPLGECKEKGEAGFWVGLSLWASGQPWIYKNSTFAKAIWQRSAQVLGASPKTSLASLVSRRLGLGGLVGKAVPYVGVGLMAWDVGGIIGDYQNARDGISTHEPIQTNLGPVDGISGADRATGR